MNLAQLARQRRAATGFTEIVGRDRGLIVLRNPTNGRFCLESISGGHGMHLPDGTEIDTAWVDADAVLDAPWLKKMVLAEYHAYAGPGVLDFDAGQIIRYVDPDSGAEISFQPQQLQWSNDLDQIEAIGDPAAVAAVVSDDTLTWAGAYGAGLDFVWQTQPVRLSKRLVINNLAALGSPPQFIIDGGNPYLRLQFIFQKSAGVSVWINGAEWSEQSNNPQTTTGAVEFRDSQNNVLWTFAPAVATDESATDAELLATAATYHFRKQANNLFVEVRLPWAWLETANYPVHVDPSVNPAVAASADDADEKANGSPQTSATSLTMTSNTIASQNWAAGCRFLTSTIANGDTVTTCYVTLDVANTSLDDPNINMWFEDGDSPGTFTTTDGDVDGRTRTTATNTWVASGIGAGTQNSPSLVSPAQEVVDRGGFSAGNYMVFLVEGVGDFSSQFAAKSYDGTGTAPTLYLEWSSGGEQLAANISRVKRQRAAYLRM